jgi:uncharacterized phage protein gp47/JayE
MSFGLTATGFNRKTVQDILGEIEASQKSLIDPEMDVSSETPIGQLNGIFADKLGEEWELAEAVNANQYPDTASDFGLDGVSSITGTFRRAATKGTVTLDLSLNAGVTVPTGSIAEVTGDSTNRWVTTADATNSTGSPAVVPVEAEAEFAGATAANAGTIAVISTPIAGWTAVTNPLDAEIGTEIDTDAQLRLRREQELSLAGSGTVNAIRADLLAVEDVTSVTVFHNPGDAIDVNGLPPHSVEAIVLGGADVDVREALFATVGGGIRTIGSITGTVIDDQGFTQASNFSRPTNVLIWLEIDIDITPADYPSNGDDLVKAAVVLFGATSYIVGGDVVLSNLNVPIFSIAGVEDVTEIQVGRAVSPSSTVNEVIAARELAILDTTRIVVATSVFVP